MKKEPLAGPMSCRLALEGWRWRPGPRLARQPAVGQNFHPAAPGLGRFFPGGGIGGRPALSTAVRTRVLVAWSMEWREPLMNYGPCSIMEAGLAWGTCTIRFHNQAKVGTWWFGQQ